MTDEKIGFTPPAEGDEPECDPQQYTMLQIFLQILWDRWSGGLGWGLFIGFVLGCIL
jgi:hypothetical protein